jgi:hypothetical protein
MSSREMEQLIICQCRSCVWYYSIVDLFELVNVRLSYLRNLNFVLPMTELILRHIYTYLTPFFCSMMIIGQWEERL